MAGFDDEILGAPPAKPPVHALGQPIDDLSAAELAERIATAQELEIERLERAIAQREATRNAAAVFFKILTLPVRLFAGTPLADAVASLTSY